MSVHFNSSVIVCIWLMQSCHTYFFDFLYTFSREMLSYLTFVKKCTQISYWNCACYAFKLVNKVYTDEVQNNWVEKSIHELEKTIFA